MDDGVGLGVDACLGQFLVCSVAAVVLLLAVVVAAAVIDVLLRNRPIIKQQL